MQDEQLKYYESLFALVSQMRTAHWDAKKRYSKSASDKEYRLSLQLDKMIREENKRRQSIQSQIKTNQ